uniref:EamA domain-containing protein n=1 Tax=Grammatophora oceanica TaxID=210454 RepID=A0A7S1USS9_9STRA|mmetsp:Transcript_1710/g.2313  ORF Transcript_1710/g.2313 Transcript_1710/m.2313 type:complete len:185 (+) Transcript_1710:1-555(+)
MLPCLLGLAIATVSSSLLQLVKAERVTVSVECCYQNVGIATSVALAMFEGDELAEAMGVPFFYGLMEAVILAIYCLIAWKAGWTRAPYDENICTILTTSYEVIYAEQQEMNEIEVQISDSSDDHLQEVAKCNVLTLGYFILEEPKGKKVPSGMVREPSPTSAALVDKNNNNTEGGGKNKAGQFA